MEPRLSHHSPWWRRDGHATTSSSAVIYISQATKQSAATKTEQFSTDTFLNRNAAEQGAGAFIGHLTTPGITRPLQGPIYSEAFHRPLSIQKIVEAAHELGGIVTYTHPMEPAYQLHWMGAIEA